MYDWKTLLQQQVGAAGVGETARTLSVSRAAVSLLANGKYPGNTERMAERIVAIFGTVMCPQTENHIPRTTCMDMAGLPMPTSSPAALRQWRTCKHCINNPNKTK